MTPIVVGTDVQRERLRAGVIGRRQHIHHGHHETFYVVEVADQF
jgi:hypothetical protein